MTHRRNKWFDCIFGVCSVLMLLISACVSANDWATATVTITKSGVVRSCKVIIKIKYLPLERDRDSGLQFEAFVSPNADRDVLLNAGIDDIDLRSQVLRRNESAGNAQVIIESSPVGFVEQHSNVVRLISVDHLRDSLRDSASISENPFFQGFTGFFVPYNSEAEITDLRPIYEKSKAKEDEEDEEGKEGEEDNGKLKGYRFSLSIDSMMYTVCYALDGSRMVSEHTRQGGAVDDPPTFVSTSIVFNTGGADESADENADENADESRMVSEHTRQGGAVDDPPTVVSTSIEFNEEGVDESATSSEFSLNPNPNPNLNNAEENTGEGGEAVEFTSNINDSLIRDPVTNRPDTQGEAAGGNLPALGGLAPEINTVVQQDSVVQNAATQNEESTTPSSPLDRGSAATDLHDQASRLSGAIIYSDAK